MKYADDRKFIEVYVCKKPVALDKSIAKIKRYNAFASHCVYPSVEISVLSLCRSVDILTWVDVHQNVTLAVIRHLHTV